MKKTFLLVVACVMSMLASAQIFDVLSVQELPGASLRKLKWQLSALQATMF